MAKKGNDGRRPAKGHRADADSPWKLILRQYFQQAIEFFFPNIAEQIDWTIPVEFLDKEFVQLTPNSEIGKRLADQCVPRRRMGGLSPPCI